jgi:copper transport protein
VGSGRRYAGSSARLGGASLGALTLFAVLTFIAPSVTHAQALHARLVQSNPADGSVLATPPSTLRLLFSEPVQIAGQPITVLAPSGKEVERGAAHVTAQALEIALAAQEQGTYLVLWQVISLDTDIASGRLVFSVGHAAGQWTGAAEQVSSISPGTLLAALARWLYFVGYTLGFGTLAFRWLVVRSLALKDVSRVDERLWRLVNFGLLALILAAPLALLAQLVSLGANNMFNTALIGAVLSSRFGWVLAQRLGGALLLWVIVGAAKQGTRLAVPLALALGVVVAAVESEASHTISSSNIAVGVIATTLHMVAMGIWIGGLIALLSLWREKALETERRQMVALVGQIAVISVIELAGSGLLLAWLHLIRLTDLFTTTYGQVLLAKFLLLPGVLGIALIGMRQSGRARWWQGEVLVLAGILALAGLLVSLAPPR